MKSFKEVLQFVDKAGYVSHSEALKVIGQHVKVGDTILLKGASRKSFNEKPSTFTVHVVSDKSFKSKLKQYIKRGNK